MKIEIDQSGKVGDTKVPTVLAFSNGISYSIIISAKVKRKLVLELRELNQPSVFYFQLFAVLIYILIKSNLAKFQTIYIDQEYLGSENKIKTYLIQICQKMNNDINVDLIQFTFIGKKSRAHLKAYESFKSKSADYEVGFSEVISYFTKKRDRGSYRKR